MSIDPKLMQRSDSKCELCTSPQELTTYDVPHSEGQSHSTIVVCSTCNSQINSPEALDTNHWRCLNDSMWSSTPAVQVMAYRLLKRLESEVWAQELLDMLYLDEELQSWADAGIEEPEEDDRDPTKDSNGTTLQAGDNVVIIKDLDVKGTSMTAKRGTAVRGISLTNNPEHIEGRVNGQRIVILSCYVKKM